MTSSVHDGCTYIRDMLALFFAQGLGGWGGRDGCPSLFVSMSAADWIPFTSRFPTSAAEKHQRVWFFRSTTPWTSCCHRTKGSFHRSINRDPTNTWPHANEKTMQNKTFHFCRLNPTGNSNHLADVLINNPDAGMMKSSFWWKWVKAVERHREKKKKLFFFSINVNMEEKIWFMSARGGGKPCRIMYRDLKEPSSSHENTSLSLGLRMTLFEKGGEKKMNSVQINARLWSFLCKLDYYYSDFWIINRRKESDL